MIKFGSRPVSSAAILAALQANPAIWPDGTTAVPGAAFAAEPGTGFRRLGAGQTAYVTSNTDRLNLYSGGIINAGTYGWGSGVTSFDLVLARDAANALAQRNGVNAQAFRLYNTFTDASNYERLSMQWNSNVIEIGSQAAGTGTVRPFRLSHGATIIGLEDTGGNPGGASVGVYRNSTSGVTILGVGGTGLTSTALLHTRLMPSINQASGTYTVLDINPTETAIGAGPHYLLRGRIGGGGNVFEVTNGGALTAAGQIVSSSHIFTGGAAHLGWNGRGFWKAPSDGIFAATDNAGTSGAVLELLERSDPAAPAANIGRLYVRDNGSGKTQLVVRFPTGAIQVIATEP